MKRVAILFDNFGPYHQARLRAAASVCELLAVEVARHSGEYAWESGAGREAENKGQTDKVKAFRVECLFKGTSEGVSAADMVARVAEVLGDFCPDVVVVPGWASRAALAALRWSLANKVPAVVMSESTAWDDRRSSAKEWVKRRFVPGFSAGLAGGAPHADYLAQLGMPLDRIFLGYDAVDNDYFSAKVDETRKQKAENRQKFNLPENYFLASARFVEKKNLPRLLQAYARYRALASQPSTFNLQPSTTPWSLVLLGDGPLRPDLERLISDLRLQSSVHLPGFKQYPDLPAYYGCASAFIHASTTEQWGLVVNEAMASGLPVLVSNRCGCAPDLVQEGVNGFTFDPYDTESLAQLMLKTSAFNFPLSAFGSESQRIISNWGPERFASGLKGAVDKALEASLIKTSLLQRMILEALLYR